MAEDAPAPVARTRRGRRRRGGAARAARGGLWTVARLVQAVARIVALILVVGIALVVLDANQANGIVEAVLDAARFLAGPFDDMFKPEGAETRVAVNWGIAAAVYLIAGALVARLLRR